MFIIIMEWMKMMRANKILLPDIGDELGNTRSIFPYLPSPFSLFRDVSVESATLTGLLNLKMDFCSKSSQILWKVTSSTRKFLDC